jgi:hypothetical protein
LPGDDNGEAELTQWLKANVTSIRDNRAKTYASKLADAGIDSVVRLLSVANDSNDRTIESIISNNFDLVDFKSVVASMTKAHLSSPGIKVTSTTYMSPSSFTTSTY